MARKKTSPVEGLFEIAVLLPWWAGVGLALVAYFVCHSFATAEIAVGTKPGELGHAIGQTIVKTIASVAQYVLPMILLAGAAASAIAKAKYKTRFPRQVRSQAANGPRPNGPRPSGPPGPKSVEPWSDQHGADIYPIGNSASAEVAKSEEVDATRWSAELLAALEWKRFEEVCAGLFERLGFSTKLATCGADGGIDIHLYRPPTEQPVAIVQCKAWTKQVGVKVIRELRGVMTSERVAKGIFVTTSTYSDDAIAFAQANQIHLMDGDEVLKTILKGTEEQRARLLQLATAGDYTTPTCASCGVKMIARRRKLGGKSFWGCVNYPKCKMIINMAGV
jgi:restriction system protein